ncbi:MAG TPA: hypothetical protein PLE19_09845 [Planctomycetota bacterium]|nr:hypothetical protein [Planctomycetota bacterium]HRR79215.1 hypothetical protein [Planctomycetota bacterium]HRT94240.1 hypothetical protein [Planctomycetota bacterium]
MKNTLHVLCAAAFAAAAGLALMGCWEEKKGDAAAPPANAQTTCPVMGGKIDKRFFADYEGKRVYFCCDDCPETFKKDPAAYIKKLEDAGVVLDKTPRKGG